HNPNGIWSYGYSSTLNSALVLFDNNQPRLGVDSWASSQIGVDPNVIYNQTGSDVVLAGTVPLQPGDLMFHPGPSGQFSHIIFTAPAAGTYSIAGSFGGLDIAGTSTDVHVLINGVERFKGNVNGTRGSLVPFSLQAIALRQGDTIDFAVGVGADGGYADERTLLRA